MEVSDGQGVGEGQSGAQAYALHQGIQAGSGEVARDWREAGGATGGGARHPAKPASQVAVAVAKQRAGEGVSGTWGKASVGALGSGAASPGAEARHRGARHFKKSRGVLCEGIAV